VARLTKHAAPPSGKIARGGEPTRERILEAALDVFAQRGYEGTTVREICQRAQANVGGINYYWRSKEQLWQAICAECARRILSAVAPRFDLGGSIEEALPAFVEAIFEALVRDPRPARILMWIALQGEAMEMRPILTTFQPLVDLFLAYLDRQEAAGHLVPRIELRLAVPMLYYQALFAFIDRIGHRHFYGKDVSDPDHARRYLDAFLEVARLILGFRTRSP
jgi:AcrR family transcriptional regulator